MLGSCFEIAPLEVMFFAHCGSGLLRRKIQRSRGRRVVGGDTDGSPRGAAYDDRRPMNEEQNTLGRVGVRSHLRLAVFLMVLLATGGRAPPEETGRIALLRTPHRGTPPTISKAGHLKPSPTGNCLMFFADEQSPYSLIFDENIVIEVAGDELYLDGKASGPLGSEGIPVAILGRDGPTSYYDGIDVSGPIELLCSQTQPLVVEHIRVAPYYQASYPRFDSVCCAVSFRWSAVVNSVRASGGRSRQIAFLVTRSSRARLGLRDRETLPQSSPSPGAVGVLRLAGTDTGH